MPHDLDVPTPATTALATLRGMGEVLDGQGIALCLFDDAGRTLLWNRAFLHLFPEHDGHVHAGEPYAENLRRFYAARLGETDQATLAQCVAEGVQRHRTQHQPFTFEHRGRWLRAASLPLAGIGRVRVWTEMAAPPAEGSDTPPLPFDGGAGDGWAVAEADGCIRRANRWLALLFGLPDASAAQSLTLDGLLRHAWRGADPAALEPLRLTLAEGLRFVGVPFELALPGGRWLRVLQQRRADGGSVSSFADITAPKRMQAELEAARAAAEAASRAKDSLLATVSHELRTPLNALIGLLAYLGEDGLGEEARRRLALAQEAAGGMLALVEDILRFSEQEARGVTVERTATDLRGLLEGVRGLLAGRADAQGLFLRAEVAPELPAALLLDGQRLRQVLLNLVGNALKFTEAGGVVISAAREEAVLAITVADTGIGIAPEAQAGIFEPFAQADPAHGRRHGGSGLGLAICRSLMTAMGGRIGVRSRPGEGSRFVLHLPCEEAVAPPPPATAGLRVLVVDDQPLNREVARLHLATLGAAVTVAADGRAAVQRAAEGFDVILMDLDMPGLDGFAAARAIRADPQAGGACILALSAHAEDGYRARAAEAGLDGFVVKPATASQLAAAIAGALLDAAVTGPLREALGDADWEALVASFAASAHDALDEAAETGHARALHALKGVAWNVGARRLGDRAAALERLPAGAMRAGLPALRRLLEASLAALRARGQGRP